MSGCKQLPRIRCPQCGATLGKFSEDRTTFKVRTGGVLAFRQTKAGKMICETTCKSCKSDIPIPIKLDMRAA